MKNKKSMNNLNSIYKNKKINNDEILSLIAKRELALNLIKSAKSPFVKKDRYRQVKNIEKKLKQLGYNNI